MSDHSQASRLYKRTLTAGALLGALGLLTILFADLYLNNSGVDAFNGQNGIFVFLTRLYSLAMTAFLPFSAALVSAALVMKYWDKRLQVLGAPDEDDGLIEAESDIYDR